MSDKWTFEALADAWESIMWQSVDFQRELQTLCNVNSYLDRTLCAQFCDETQMAQSFVEAVLLWVAGWTEAEFEAVLYSMVVADSPQAEKK